MTVSSPPDPGRDGLERWKSPSTPLFQIPQKAGPLVKGGAEGFKKVIFCIIWLIFWKLEI